MRAFHRVARVPEDAGALEDLAHELDQGARVLHVDVELLVVPVQARGAGSPQAVRVLGALDGPGAPAEQVVEVGPHGILRTGSDLVARSALPEQLLAALGVGTIEIGNRRFGSP